MYCVKCGKEIPDDSKVCMYCGRKIINSNENVHSEEILKEQKKFLKKKRKWWKILIIILALIFICLLWIGSGSDGSEKEIEDYVKSGTYKEYTSVSLGEVLEYNWKDGQWDSFEAENDGNSFQVVEYAADENRSTYVQFAVDVDEENFEMVYMKKEGEEISKEDADIEMESMYYTYFNEQYPINDIDLNNYVGKEIQELLDDTAAFYETDEELLVYEDVSRNVQIMLDEKIPYLISIEGDGTYSPVFAGNSVGQNLSELEKSKITESGYTEIVWEDESNCIYGNPDNKSTVTYVADETGKIVNIIWNADTLDEMTEATNATKEEQYIFPDSDKKYLSEDEVRSQPVDKLYIGRNEIFARHGYIFQDPNLKEHFEGTSWYKGTVTGDQFNADAVFNDFEKKNVELIKRIEDELNGVNNATFIGKTGVYCTLDDNENGWTGWIEILNVQNDILTFELGALTPDRYIVMTETAQITGQNTAQYSAYGFTITFTWSDDSNMFVTNSGEITGTDSGIVMDVTDRRDYAWAAQFNR